MRTRRNIILPALCGSVLACCLFGQAAYSVERMSHILTIHNAGKGAPFKRIASIFFEPDSKELFVTDRSAGRIYVFGENGALRFTHNTPFASKFPLKECVVNSQGDMYVSVAYSSPKIAILDFRGNQKGYVDLSTAKGDSIVPLRIGIDAADNLYVLDEKSMRVRVFDEKGLLSKDIINHGEGLRKGEVGTHFSDIAFDKKGNIYLLCRSPRRIFMYSKDGKLLRTFGNPGGGPGKFSRPVSVCVGENGLVHVVDSNRHTVLVYHPKGTFLFEYGWMGDKDGEFYFPQSICADDKGRIYVADGLRRIQIFKLAVTESDEDVKGEE